MCDGVVPTDSSFSMSGHQESVGVHVDAHSQHVVFDVVSWCGPFRHPLLRHHQGPIILTHGPKLRPLRLGFRVSRIGCLTPSHATIVSLKPVCDVSAPMIQENYSL